MAMDGNYLFWIKQIRAISILTYEIDTKSEFLNKLERTRDLVFELNQHHWGGNPMEETAMSNEQWA